MRTGAELGRDVSRDQCPVEKALPAPAQCSRPAASRSVCLSVSLRGGFQPYARNATHATYATQDSTQVHTQYKSCVQKNQKEA